MAAEIKKIVLQLGKKEVELTVDEAKELFKGLNEMFGEKEVIREHYYHRDYRWVWEWPRYTLTTGGTTWKYSPNTSTVFCSTRA